MASRNPIIRRAEDQYAKDYSGPGFAAVNTGSGVGCATSDGAAFSMV